MFRRAAQPLRSVAAFDIEESAWQVRNKHFAGAFGVLVGLFVLFRHEMKGDMEGIESRLKSDMKGIESRLKEDMEGIESRLKGDMEALGCEIRTALAAMNVSRGAMDAHAQFYRDSNRGLSAGR